MGAGIITTGGKGKTVACDMHECGACISDAPDACRIGNGTDNHEIVVHQVEPLDAVAAGDELLLGVAGMHEQDVAVSVHGVADSLPGAHGNHLDENARRIAEIGKDVIEQPRVLRLGRRLDDDGPIVGGHATRDEAEDNHGTCEES